jgi:hypothetical protein
VRHHHVPVGACSVVERRPAFDGQLLGHVDLHVPDVTTVPDRLEEPVGEPERHDVIHRLLAQEMVDAEHLRLVEHRVHRPVERPRRARSVPNGFSMITRASRARPDAPRRPMTEVNAAGGTAR